MTTGQLPGVPTPRAGLAAMAASVALTFAVAVAGV